MADRVLITGVGGQDGSYLAEQLLDDGAEVIGLARAGGRDLAALPPETLERISLVEGDLADPASLRRAVDEVSPGEIYHLAAPTFVPASWDQPALYLAQVAGATGELLAAAAAMAVPARVFVASSAEVFGDAGVSPQDERAPMRPHSPYGVAKLATHHLVRVMRQRHGLFAVSGLTFNHESPRRPPQFLPRKVTRGAAQIALGQESELVLGALDAVRDWSHAADIMRGARLALAAPEPSDYVFASGVGRTVRDLVDAAFDAAGVPDERRRVRVDPAFVRPPEATAPVGDPSHARAVLGWEPRYSFAELIGEMVAADLAELGGGASVGAGGAG